MNGPMIVSLALILISVGLYFAVIDPAYTRVQELSVRSADLTEAVDSAKSFFNTLEDKRARYQAARDDPERGGRLRELLPDAIDNTRLMLTIEDIGTRNAVSISDVSADAAGMGERLGGTDGVPVGLSRLNFQAEGTYEELFAFLRDLERSIRLVEVEHLTIQPPGEEVFATSRDPDYQFELSVVTYWLRPS